MGFFPLGITQQRCSASLVVQASSTSIPFAELLPPSCPLRMSPHSQPQSSAWVCSPIPTFQHPALVCSGGHPLRLRGQGWAQQPVYRSHSVLHTGCSVLFPQRMSLSFCPNWAPPSEGLPWMGRPLLSSVPPGFCGSHPTSFPLPFPPSFFCPTWLSRNLSCPFRCPSSSARVLQGSVRIFPLQDVFLMFLWREMNSTSSESSAILTSSISVLGLI